MLTNQSTNQHYPDPIRTVVPIHNVEVRLDVGSGSVSAVESVTGQATEWSQGDGWVTMRVTLLQAYEAFLVDLV